MLVLLGSEPRRSFPNVTVETLWRYRHRLMQCVTGLAGSALLAQCRCQPAIWLGIAWIRRYRPPRSLDSVFIIMLEVIGSLDLVHKERIAWITWVQSQRSPQVLSCLGTAAAPREQETLNTICPR